MKPSPPHQTAPVKRRGNDAQAALRMVIVAALCLGIGFGLGGFWHSRRVQRGSVSTEGANETAETVNTTAQAPATPAAPSSVAAASPDPAIVAEVKRQIPNLATVPLEEGSQILRAAALRDLQTALSQMEPQLKAAEQRVAEAKSETEKQTALKELQRLQAAQATKLSEFTTRSSSQIEVLRQLKQSAR